MVPKVVMVSGGIDSYVAWVKLNRPTAVFVEYGQPYLELERQAVQALFPGIKIVRVMDLPPLGDEIHVPARNLFFATIGCRFSTSICLAGVSDEICSDKSQSAFRDMSRILTKHNGTRTTVSSPLWGFTKESAIRDYLDSGNPVEPLLDTVSCYKNGLQSCYDCEACFRRTIALANNGIRVQGELSRTIIRDQIMKLHDYTQGRVRSIISGLRFLDVNILVCYPEAYRPGWEYTVVMTDRPKSDRLKILRRYDVEGCLNVLTEQVKPS